MKILHVIWRCGTGGAEGFVRDLSIAMKARGHTVEIAYIASAKDQGASPEFERYFQQTLDAAGIRYRELGYRTRRNPILGALALRRCLRAFKPDIVHLHMPTTVMFRLLAPGQGRTVFTYHNTFLPFPGQLFRLFDLVVDRYVAICDAAQAVLAPLVGRPIERIYNGITASRMTARVDRPDAERPIVLSVGNLEHRKGYDVLIEAVVLLRGRLTGSGMQPLFLIAGEGGERSNIEAAIRARQLEDWVKLLGTRSDINDLMASAQLFAMTSRYEGFPIALIECAHAGLPAVVTDVGGCREIVREGRNGFVVASEDCAAVADRLHRLLSNRELRERQGEQARLLAREFSIEQSADQHLAFYARTLEGRT